MGMAAAIRAGRAYVEVTTDNSKLLKGLASAQARLRTFGQTLKGVGGDMMMTAGAISMPFVMAGKAYADFDDSMRTLGAVSGATGSFLQNLDDFVRKLGANTAFTARQTAEGAVSLARMGFTAGELYNALPAVMNLTRATGTQMYRLGEVSAYAAAQVRIFGLSNSSFSDVADVMATAANRSAMDIGDLGEAMKIAGPSARTVGENFRDTAAALMVMANAGIRGSLAGSSMRKVYESLAAQTEEGKKGKNQLIEMGIRVTDPKTGNLRKAADIMVDLAKKVKAMRSGQKINFATDVFDLRGSLGALAMLNNSFDLQKARQQLQNTAGYAAKAAKKIEEGFGGMVRLVKSRLEDLSIALGKSFYDSLKGQLDKIAPAISIITNFVNANKRLTAYLMTGTVAVFGFGAALFALGAAAKIAAFALGGVYMVVKGLAAVILLPWNALVLLNSGLEGLSSAAKIAGSGFAVFGAGVRGVLTLMGGMFGIVKMLPALHAIRGSFISCTVAMKMFRVVTVTGAAIIGAVSGVFRGLAAAIRAIPVLVNGAKAAWAGMMAGFAAVKSAIAGVSVAFTAIKTAVSGFITAIQLLRSVSVVAAGSMLAVRGATAGVAMIVQGANGALVGLRVSVLGVTVVMRAVASSTAAASVALKIVSGVIAANVAVVRFAKAAWTGMMTGFTVIRGGITGVVAAFNLLRTAVFTFQAAAVMGKSAVVGIGGVMMTAKGAAIAMQIAYNGVTVTMRGMTSSLLAAQVAVRLVSAFFTAAIAVDRAFAASLALIRSGLLMTKIQMLAMAAVSGIWRGIMAGIHGVVAGLAALRAAVTLAKVQMIAFGAVKVIFGGLVKGLSAVGGAINGIIKKLLVAPAALLGTVAWIAAIGVAIYLFWDEIKAAFSAGWNFIKGFFAKAFAPLKNLGSELMQSFSAAFGVLKETFGQVMDAMNMGDMKGALKVGLAGLRLAFETGIAPLRKAWNTLANTLLDVWGGIWLKIQNTTDAAMVAMQKAMMRVKIWAAGGDQKVLEPRFQGMDVLLKRWQQQRTDAYYKEVSNRGGDHFQNTALENARKNYDQAKQYVAQFRDMKKTVEAFERAMGRAGEIYKNRYEDKDQSRDIKNWFFRKNNGADPAVVKKEIENQQRIADKAADAFKDALKKAQADRVIDKDERAALNALIVKAGRAQELKSRYEAMLNGARNATGNALQNSRRGETVGAWSVRELSGMFRNTSAERTANAAENIQKQGTSMIRWLEQIAKTKATW